MDQLLSDQSANVRDAVKEIIDGRKALDAPDLFRKTLKGAINISYPIVYFGHIEIVRYGELQEISADIVAARSFTITDCPKLKSISGNLCSHEKLKIENCTNLTEITGDIQVAEGTIEIFNCPKLRRLPKVLGEIHLELPDKISKKMQRIIHQQLHQLLTEEKYINLDDKAIQLLNSIEGRITLHSSSQDKK